MLGQSYLALHVVVKKRPFPAKISHAEEMRGWGEIFILRYGRFNMLIEIILSPISPEAKATGYEARPRERGFLAPQGRCFLASPFTAGWRKRLNLFYERASARFCLADDEFIHWRGRFLQPVSFNRTQITQIKADKSGFFTSQDTINYSQ